MKKTQLLWISYFSMVLIGTQAGALGVAWIHMQKTFNQPLSSLGVLLGAMAIGRLVITSNTGRLIAWRGVRALMAAGIIISIIGYAGFAFIQQWYFVVLANFLAGLGTACISMSMNTFLATNYSASRMNWLHASFGLGAIIGPILVTILVIDLDLSWRWNFILVIGFYAVLLVLALANQWPMEPGITPNARPIQPRDTLRLPIVWYAIMVFFFATGIEMSTGQLSNNLLVDGRGIDPKLAGTWVSLYWVSFTLGRTLTGFVVDRISNSILLRLNILGAMIGAVFLWMDMSLLGLLILGFSIAPLAPTLISDTPHRMGKGHATNAIGFQFTGGSIAIAFMPWLGGLLAEHLGLEIIPPFILILGVLAFILHEMLLNYEKQPVVMGEQV